MGLGFLTAALGLGSVISALVVASTTSASRSMLFAGGAAFAVLLGAMAISRWFPLSIGLLLLLGVASTAFLATANTSLQLVTPDHLRGRVMALYMLLFAGSTPIGGYLTGVLSESMGVPAALGIEAALCFVGVAAGGLYYLGHRHQIAQLGPALTAAAPALRRL